MNECSDELSPSAADDADDVAEAFAPYGFRRILQLLRRWRFGFSFSQRLGDGTTTLQGGRGIDPATLSKPVAVLALTVAVIPPNLGIGLITPIRFPLL